MKKSKRLRAGFTLIELLVVIAIIGILASIVLASLNSARNKGSDAKVQSQIANMRSAAEVYYASHGNSYNQTGTNYDGLSVNACSPQAGMFADAISGMSALSKGSNYPSGTQLVCSVSADGTQWAVSASLSDGSYWCADSAGASAPEPSPSIYKCS